MFQAFKNRFSIVFLFNTYPLWGMDYINLPLHGLFWLHFFFFKEDNAMALMDTFPE